jgi:hypothetical protein
MKNVYNLKGLKNLIVKNNSIIISAVAMGGKFIIVPGCSAERSFHLGCGECLAFKAGIL